MINQNGVNLFMILFQNVWLKVNLIFFNFIDHNERYDTIQLMDHPFILKGKELDSKTIIKELVKSKINDLEDNREKNFKKEIQNLENDEPLPGIIVKNNKPKGKYFFIFIKSNEIIFKITRKFRI